jgi:nitrogen-specific signal transduction histidine kinase/CheY-like chemotaxis protein
MNPSSPGETGAPAEAPPRDPTEERGVEERRIEARKMEAIGSLAGAIAHDFNNLLGVVIGNLDLLREQPGGNAETDDLAREALDAAMRGAKLTRGLLAFAQRQPLQPQRIAVNEVVTGLAHRLRQTLGGRYEVALDLAPEVWPVVADPAQLEAALVNLATNARDAMPDGGRLAVATGNARLDEDYAAHYPDLRPGEYALIAISDTGSGMPPEIVARIFEPFFTTKEHGQGTGLGLATVFGYMKQSGGHINVYSEVGIGTTFRLYLPRAGRAEGEARAPAAAELPAGRGETVLVVEDNAALRRVALRQLSQLGYDVLAAENAPAALALLETRTGIDVLFTDVVMPGGMDGLELARLALARWPAMGVVLASGFPQSRARAESGIPLTVRLLNKPYRKDELAQALRAAVDGARR